MKRIRGEGECEGATGTEARPTSTEANPKSRIQNPKSESSRYTRREFLGRAAVSGVMAAPLVIPASAYGARDVAAPGERITVGVIGLGAMGMGHLAYCLGDRSMQLLAVCDVDRVRREEGRRRAEAAYADARGSGTYRGCAAYNDYREMLARPDLDAVLIATPDHWHALQSVDAAKAGKDVYCEKPISLTIAEGRRLVEVVRACACVFQTGTQYRSMPPTRRVCEFVRRGGLGKVKQVFTLWSRVEDGYVPVSYPLPAEPVPDGLDWALWVGPAPWRPYNSRFHRNPIPGVVPWAFCEDFGAASVTWHHSHSADVVQYGLGVENSGPVEILPPGSGPFPTLTYRYAGGTLLHLVDDWGQVKNLYGAVPAGARLEGNFGGVFVGERGWVTSMYGGGPIEGEPKEIFAEMGLQNRQVSGANNHHANWLECIRTRGRASTGEEIGHRSASLGHLAHIAFKLQRRLKWDPVTEAFTGDAEANRLRSRAMREPWHM
jgi:hypothetical protein